MSTSITVVVPVYNAASGGLLDEALDSLRAQTFSDWNCICVDDGSTDASPEILARFAAMDKRFGVLTQANGGLSRARNAGFDAATGEWVFFLDADDKLYPEALSTLHELAMRTGADVVWGRHTRTGLREGDGEMVAEGRQLRKLLEKNFGRGPAAEGGASFADVPVMAWNKLYRRSFLADNGIRHNDEVRRSEDIVFQRRVMCRVRKIAMSGKVTYFYRNVPGSLYWDVSLAARKQVVDAVCRFAEENAACDTIDLSGYFAGRWVLSWLRAAWRWAREGADAGKLFEEDCRRLGEAFSGRMPMLLRLALAWAPCLFRMASAMRPNKA